VQSVNNTEHGRNTRASSEKSELGFSHIFLLFYIPKSISFVGNVADRTLHKESITNLLGAEEGAHDASVGKLLSDWVALDNEVYRAFLVKRRYRCVHAGYLLLALSLRWFENFHVLRDREAHGPFGVGKLELETYSVWADLSLLSDLQRKLVVFILLHLVAHSMGAFWDVNEMIRVTHCRFLSGAIRPSI